MKSRRAAGVHLALRAGEKITSHFRIAPFTPSSTAPQSRIPQRSTTTCDARSAEYTCAPCQSRTCSLCCPGLPQTATQCFNKLALTFNKLNEEGSLRPLGLKGKCYVLHRLRSHLERAETARQIRSTRLSVREASSGMVLLVMGKWSKTSRVIRASRRMVAATLFRLLDLIRPIAKRCGPARKSSAAPAIGRAGWPQVRASGRGSAAVSGSLSKPCAA